MAEQESAEEVLRLARETIDRQRQEIESLRREQADASTAAQLRRILLEAGAAAALSEPSQQDDLLEMLLETASAATGASASSLLVTDPAAGNLVFRAATGPKAHEIRQFVVPLGQGIAGFVAETGQPMAVSNVTEDARFYRDIGQSLNYIPSSMLCVPIRRGDDIIGVIQLLDKVGEDAFTARDMEIVGSFVRQAAVAIEQTSNLHDISGLLLISLRHLAGEGSINPDIEQDIRTFVQHTTAGSTYGEAMALAGAIAEIGREGPAELTLAHAILNSFRDYLHSRNAPLFTMAGFG
ncbi:MAG: GAF domain-containing protein [Dehalococcoidia bacterium]